MMLYDVYERRVHMQYPTILVDLPTTIHSFVRHINGVDTIVINSRLSVERQRECYIHEVSHIKNGDFYKDCSADVIESKRHIK